MPSSCGYLQLAAYDQQTIYNVAFTDTIFVLSLMMISYCESRGGEKVNVMPMSAGIEMNPCPVKAPY